MNRIKIALRPAVYTCVYGTLLAVVIFSLRYIKYGGNDDLFPKLFFIYIKVAIPFVLSTLVFGITKEYISESITYKRWVVGFSTTSTWAASMILFNQFLLERSDVIPGLIFFSFLAGIGVGYDKKPKS